MSDPPRASSSSKRRRAGSLDAYSLGALLGEGAFGSVRSGTDSSGTRVAVKQLNKARTASDVFEREARMLRGAGTHQHVTCLIDSFESPAQWVIVMELAGGGEVFERIVQRGPLSERDAALVVRHVARALAHLAARDIVHRDLKPENLLFVSEAEGADVKLTDFGLAAFCAASPRAAEAGGEERPATVSGLAGTEPYMAPEMVRLDAYSHCVDVWSLGVCLFTLLSGYLPFDPHGTAPPRLVQRNILRGEPDWSAYPQQWEPVSQEARALIGRMLALRPEDRATPAQLLATPWVAGAAAAASLPGSDAQLKSFNAARRVWRTAANAVALVIRAPHTAAAAALAAGSAAAEAQQPAAAAAALPKAAREELKAAFAAFDRDGDGTIDLAELRDALSSLGASEGDAEATLARRGRRCGASATRPRHVRVAFRRRRSRRSTRTAREGSTSTNSVPPPRRSTPPPPSPSARPSISSTPTARATLTGRSCGPSSTGSAAAPARTTTAARPSARSTKSSRRRTPTPTAASPSPSSSPSSRRYSRRPQSDAPAASSLSTPGARMPPPRPADARDTHDRLGRLPTALPLRLRPALASPARLSRPHLPPRNGSAPPPPSLCTLRLAPSAARSLQICFRSRVSNFVLTQGTPGRDSTPLLSSLWVDAVLENPVHA